MKTFLYVLFYISIIKVSANNVCDASAKDVGCTQPIKSFASEKRYMFYDVNSPEGFNLRRDVFMRMSRLVRNLKKYSGNWTLVLPPWPHLYHWQSEDVTDQRRLPWSTFFNVPSLAEMTPVIEMHEFLQTGLKNIDEVYILQHFEDTFTSNNFDDRFKIESCLGQHHYKHNKGGKFSGYFWGYSNITAGSVKCLSFHGAASTLKEFIQLSTASTIMFDHAEVVLHDQFGDKTYWRIRKSMKFADHLINEANEYLMKQINFSSENIISDGKIIGGPYLCVHLRRRDFVRGRSKETPTLEGAAKQIKRSLKELDLNTVFIATDAPEEEKVKLERNLKNENVLSYKPSIKMKKKIKDGGVAIVEQIICSRARKFIGTHESTFSFRIQEEREIMGFSSETTFSRLCGDKEVKCEQPSRWKIVY